MRTDNVIAMDEICLQYNIQLLQRRNDAPTGVDGHKIKDGADVSPFWPFWDRQFALHKRMLKRINECTVPGGKRL